MNDKLFLVVMCISAIVSVGTCLRALYMFSEYVSLKAIVKGHDYHISEAAIDGRSWRAIDSDYTRKTELILEYRDSDNRLHTTPHVVNMRLGKIPSESHTVWHHKDTPEKLASVDPWTWLIYAGAASVFVFVPLLKS